MSWLDRLEHFFQDRLEAIEARDALEHCYELERLLPRRLVARRYCPNRIVLPEPLPQALLNEFEQEAARRGWVVAAAWHQQLGQTELEFAYPGRPAADYLVEVTAGLGVGKCALVDRSRASVVGRAEDAELRLGYPGLSRRHLELTVSEGGLRVTTPGLTSHWPAGKDYEIEGSRLRLWPIRT
ncbi:MAG: FHA domain-containing protein [Candidatus Eremiobacteraeota bacterium]|nr:FHA domain-containing protein [Candidatus Eremiobacteraeota bacterium]